MNFDWPDGQPFDSDRAFRLADELRQISEELGHCRVDDGADMIEHLLEGAGFQRSPNCSPEKGAK